MFGISLGARSPVNHWAGVLSVALVLVAAGCASSTATPAGAGGHLSITSHVDGDTVASADIVVRGTAPAGAQITRAIASARDDHATADASGSWSIPVKLNKGPNELTFRIGDDNSSAVKIHVVFDPLFTPTATASATPSDTFTSASPSPSNADFDDETAASAGASFVPTATGIAPPAMGSGSADRLPGEPDPSLTPGALNPAVTQATIGSTICVSGWTATIRPSSSFTTALKIKQIVQYGYSDTQTSSYEEDHLISLELGGAPADARNLWPEPYTVTLADGRSTGAHVKDGFETKLKTQVCAGTITLAAAQSEIGIHWVHAYYGIALVASPTNPATTAPTARVTSAPTKPAATTGPTAHVTSPTAPPVAALSVRITSLPVSVGHGANATLTAVTSPGSTCSASVTYASGTVSTAAGLQTQPVAGSSGTVSWTWKVGASTGPGTSTASVTCSLGDASASASKDFQVT